MVLRIDGKNSGRTDEQVVNVRGSLADWNGVQHQPLRAQLLEDPSDGYLPQGSLVPGPALGTEWTGAKHSLESGTGAHEALDCHQFLDDGLPGHPLA
jgi:hypothetical protein